MGGSGTGNTGGNGGTESNDGWSDESSSTLWGWLDGIVNGLKTVWEAVTNLPQLIAEKLSGFFTELKLAIMNLPNAILNGIKAIFIPDEGYIQESFDSFLEEMKMKFNLDVSAFENLFQGEAPVSDTYTDYEIPNVGEFHLKVFDSSFLSQGVAYFRPIIRGFLVLMMLLFHVKQLIGFFGYDSGIVAGRSEHIKSARESQKE